MIDRFFAKLFCIFVVSAMLMGATASALLPPLTQFGTLNFNKNLPIAADVQALTDTSGTFVNGTAPDLSKVPAGWSMVDPSLLYLGPATTGIKMYLVGEDAAYRNTVGISIGQDYTLNPGDPQLVFGDTTLPGNPAFVNPTTQVQALSGIVPGKLDFFLAADGANPKPIHDLYWTDTSVVTPVPGTLVNPDGLQHAMAFLYNNGQYLLYAWEDLPQLGDFDFNDVFVLLRANDRIIVVPETSTYLLLGSFLLCAAWLYRRKKAYVAVNK